MKSTVRGAVGLCAVLTIGICWRAPVDAVQKETANAKTKVSWEDFGVVGDGKADDTAALQKAIDSGVGDIRLTRAVYRLTKPLVIDLDRVGYTSIHGNGVATLKMEGAGPAIRVEGTHYKSADPGGFETRVWDRQRMPLIDGVGIVGGHADADGIEASGAMQLTVTRVHIRKCRHGIRLVDNNRNVIISDCHIYENRGVGVYYDNVNLHQSNITGCHISYNDRGGIVSRAGNVRNIHIAGCDLESNMAADTPATANVLIDCRGSKYGTAEVAITGCTIQHNNRGPDSANVRFIGLSDGSDSLPHVREGHLTVSGNVFSDVMVNVHLQHCRGATLTGNTFWMGYDYNLLVEDCNSIVVAGNNMDRNPRYAYGTAKTTKNRVVIRDSEDCTISGLHLTQTQGGPALHVQRCRRLNFANCSILDNQDSGVVLENVSHSRFDGFLLQGNKVPQVVVTGGENNRLDETMAEK